MNSDTLLLFLLSEDEDAMLLTLCSTLERSISNSFRFDISAITEDQCIDMFRFSKVNLTRLKNAMRIPEKIVCSNGTSATSLEALLILLRRFAYPARLSDLSPIFGRSPAELSLLFNETVDVLHQRFGGLLNSLDHHWLDLNNVKEFSRAIHQNGAPLQTCWGFIDGTARPISRPGKHQKVCYSGHKRFHALNFQSVVIPNGLIVHMYGPLEGTSHDSAMLRLSGVMPQLLRYQQNGQPYMLYGDPAYPMHPHLFSPFKGGNLTEQQKAFNKEMSKCRVCVEWQFGKIVSLFAFLDFKKNLKLRLQPVGKYYLVGALLANCHTTLHGSQTGSFFDMLPPTLEEYLQG